jgi:outer membrane protein assembly factor BamB
MSNNVTKYGNFYKFSILFIFMMLTNSNVRSHLMQNSQDRNINLSDFRGSIERLGAYGDKPLLVSISLINSFPIKRPTRTTATVTDKVAIFGSETGELYALDRKLLSTQTESIEPLWTFNANNRPIVSSAVIDAEGKLYVGGLDHHLYMLETETGSLIADYETFGGIYASPLVVDDVVYIGSLDFHLYALQANNLSLLWKTNLSGEIWSSAAWGNNGKIYVGSRSGSVFALDAASGEIVWQHETGGFVDATPALYDNKVFVGSHDGTFYGLDAETGEVTWQYDTGQVIYSSAAVGVQFPESKITATEEALSMETVEGTAEAVYISNFDGDVFSFNLDDGSVLWQTNIGGPAYSSPVYVEGLLYVITEKEGLLYALDTNFGAPRWTYVTGREGDFRSASPVPYDGKLYIASNSEGLLVLGDPENP